MFLHREWTRVELEAKNLNVRHNSGQKSSHREDQKLGNDLGTKNTVRLRTGYEHSKLTPLTPTEG